MLSIKNLVKIYKPKKAEPVKALDNVSIDFAETGLVFLLGKSGSGKSTLLNAIGGLDKFDDGEIVIKGKSSKDFSATDFDSYRNTFIGFIFQEYNVLEEFTVAKNLALAVELQGRKPDNAEINKLLEQVDMLEYAKRKPNQLSGGQKQRIAIARALIKNPEIIMADEPTGALDSATGKQVMETLKRLSKDKLVIIVSHDREFAEEYGDRIIELKDGKIIKDVIKKEVPTEDNKGIKIVGDDLIIIKKGQELTKENLKTIEETIKNNIEKEDVIISLNKTSNEKVKNASSINKDGNRESFLKTTEEDVKLKDYSKKDLNLIKSRFKNTDAFKMGASSLKHKKGKLFFTILLSLVAFVLFGIVDTFSSFSVAKSTADTMAMIAPQVVSVAKAHYDRYELSLTDGDLQALEQKTNQKFYAVKTPYHYGNNFSGWAIDGVSSGSRNPMFEICFSGKMMLTEDIVNDLGLTFVGSYPTNSGEVVITKHMIDCYDKAKNYSSDTYTPTPASEIIGKKLENQNSGNEKYTIVGVIDDKVDFSKYEGAENDQMNFIVGYLESLKVNSYGFSNILFVSGEDFKQAENSNHRSSYYYIDAKTVEGASSGYTEGNFVRISDAGFGLGDVLFKPGFNKEKGLKGNQVIVTSNFLNSCLYYTNSAEAFLQESDTNIKICYDYEFKHLFTELEIVGVTYHGNQEIFTADNNPVAIKGDYSFAVTKAGSRAAINKINNAFISLKDNNLGFKFEDKTTSIIENFGNTIESITSPLLYVSVGLAVFSALFLSNFITNSISYKKREIGILRAIGAKSWDVFKIFFFESFLIAGITYVLSLIGTGVACILINNSVVGGLGLNLVLLSFGIRQIFIMLGISILIAVVATLLPVMRIAKKNPIDAINNR